MFAAILGAYYLTIPGVNAMWIGGLLLIGSLTGFIFEIPSGFFSDKIGHKTALIISRTTAVLSTAFFLFADSIPLLVLGSIFLSLGSTFISGTGSAFMHETLRALNREDEYTAVIGKSSAIGFAVPIVLMATIPFLVEISYKLPFLIALVVDAIGFVVACTLTRPPVTPEHIQEVGITNFRDVIREGYQLHFFRYALFSGIIFAFLIANGVFRAPYQVFLGIPVIWFGVLHGLGRVFASILLAYSGRIKVLFGDVQRFYKFQIIVYTSLFLILGIVSTWWVIAGVFIVINAFQWGLSKLDEGYLLEIIKTSKFKATLLSAKAQIGELFTAIFGFGLGLAIQYSSYEYAYVLLSVLLLGTLIPLYLYIARNR